MNTLQERYNKVISKQIYFDTLEGWLESRELFIRCPIAKDCTRSEECKKVLDHSFPLRMVRIADLSSGLMGISSYEYEKLDEPCKTQYYEWYYSVCYKDQPSRKITKAVFEKLIVENTLKHSLEGASSAYHTMLENYSRKETDVTKEQLESQRKYLRGIEDKYHSALRELKEEIDRAEAIAKGYETEEQK